MTETSLHAALKNLYAGTDGRQEALVAGYQIDVVQGNLLIEIQTGNFSAIKEKLISLLPSHPILLVHPIAIEKKIIQFPATGETPLYKRKSPRRGRLEDLFSELIRIPQLIAHPNLQIEVLLIREEEIRRADGRGSWRRKGTSIIDHRLIEVVNRSHFTQPADFDRFIPPGLPELFTSRDIAKALSIRLPLAYRMTYCLKKMGLIKPDGKRGRTMLYALEPNVYNPQTPSHGE